MSPIERPKPKAPSTYMIKRIGQTLYQVQHRETGHVCALGTSLENAKRHMSLLEAKFK